MKKTFILALIALLVVTAAGCGSKSQEPEAPQVDQLAETPAYTVNVPSDWQVEKVAGNSLAFKSGDAEVGGVEVLAYDGTAQEPLAGLLPNHAEVLDQQELQDFSCDTFRVKLRLSPPAASGDSSTVEQVRYYFLAPLYAYDLYLDASVDTDTAGAVAESFSLKPGGADENQDSEVKTDSGTYVGQADPTSIEIKISGVPESQASRAFQLSDELAGHWDEFGFQTGDQVRFQYQVNQYGQSVLLSIEKI